MASQPYLAVVVPAFNEASRIGSSLERMDAYLSAQSYTSSILVVDDGSTDGTADTVRQVRSDRITVLRYETNRGKGHAVRYGMLRAHGDYILFSDADLATPIEEIEHLFAAIKAGADIAIGSRDVEGSRLERRQSPIRELGGKLFTEEAAHTVFSVCTIDNFSFDVEALYVARRFGYRIAEVPVRWRHQEGSKVRLWRDAPRMLRTLFQIRTAPYPKTKPAARPSTTP